MGGHYCYGNYSKVPVLQHGRHGFAAPPATSSPLNSAASSYGTAGQGGMDMSAGTMAYIPSPPPSGQANVATTIHSDINDAERNRSGNRVGHWFEMWDYTAGALFRGFVTAGPDNGARAMFVFFDRNVTGSDLKPGLMAILELCTHPGPLASSHLTLCLHRGGREGDSGEEGGETATTALMRDLGWVGFEPTTLARWLSSGRGEAVEDQRDDVSDRWWFLGMDT